jgi:chorismate mutase
VQEARAPAEDDVTGRDVSARTVRALRGATHVDADDRDMVLAATRELVGEVLARNDLTPPDVVSIVFTATRDLTAVAPALAARQLGLHDVALICAQEMWVEGSMPRVVRLLAHVETARRRDEIVNVYLHGTEVLRADVPAVPDSGALR